jgi:hypothetical protein
VPAARALAGSLNLKISTELSISVSTFMSTFLPTLPGNFLAQIEMNPTSHYAGLLMPISPVLATVRVRISVAQMFKSMCPQLAEESPRFSPGERQRSLLQCDRSCRRRYSSTCTVIPLVYAHINCLGWFRSPRPRTWHHSRCSYGDRGRVTSAPHDLHAVINGA